MINTNNIKRDLERTSCSVHNKHPEVEINGDKINFKCCCEEFQQISLKKMKELLAREAKASIVAAFNKGLKR